MSESHFDFLMNRLDGNGANVIVHQADRDGRAGVLLVQCEDGTAFSIHFQPAE